jgi:hypothetical protein
VRSLVANAVDNPVGRRVSAANDGSFVKLSARNNSAAADHFKSSFDFIGVEAATGRAGSKTPATTRGGAA